MTTVPPVTIPAPLIEAVRSGRVILFLGSGASMEAKSENGIQPPSAKQLAADLGQHFLGQDLSDFGLMQVAEMASRARGQNVVFEHIRSQLKTFKPSPAHMLIPKFRWHTIATTNYDTLVESAYGSTNSPIQNLIPFVKDSEPIETKMSEFQNSLVYLKLHGCVEHAHDADIPLVLDPSHYERYRTNRERLFDRLSDYAHEIPFLFIGYAFSDPHIQNLIYRLNRTGSRPEYYVVGPNIPSVIAQHWLSERIVAIDATFSGFMTALDATVPEHWRQLQPGKLSRGHPIQKHFRTTSDISGNLLESLEADLLYVHPLMATEEQSARNFYRGYDRGFSGVASDLDARRRVSNDLILQLIDDQNSDGVKFYLLRGAAGTGKTICLKRIGWEISSHFDAPVLWSLENGRLRWQSIRELYDFTGKRLYLIVDQAIERLAEIEVLMQMAFAHGIHLSVISAERDATWNVGNDDFESRWDVQSFSIGQLVKSEIEDLILRLKIHSALGVLTALSPQEQIRAFDEADRHLLVALHEVTLGKPFEEIVIDECRSLTPIEAQQLYLDICTLNQFGASVRAGVINRISAIPFTIYQSKFFLPLEGVVLTQNNRYSGDFEYKSRHPRVASLVFKQAFPKDEDRVNQLARIISCLDEGYNADRQAIGALIRARNLITLLSDADQGRQVYDHVTVLLGGRWYVRHQRAIFELNHDQGSLENAEEEARAGLELEPGRSSVLHTMAEISRARAQAESDGIRKDIYRQQARERLSKIKKDHSGFVDGSRCKLRLDEMNDALKSIDAEDDHSVQVFTERTRLARQAIDDAIERHPTDADIVRLSAAFFLILRENDKARLALERAWRQKPKGPGVGLQLVRLYQGIDDTELAKKTLDEALERHPQDPGVNLAMARHIIDFDQNNDRAAYYLPRSYHASDRNYVARYLHAQYLLLINDGSRSAEIFDEVNQYAPVDYKPRTNFEITRISQTIGRATGRIAKKEESYAFLTLPAYPHDIYTNISNNDPDQWARVVHQTSVSFTVGFNRNGPVAIDIQLE